MAITAETRKDIIELVVTAYNAAPGTTLLTELVAIIDNGGTLADVADNLTTRSEWTSRYPSFQTAEEFATEWLGNLVPEASAEAMAEGKDVAVGLINGGSSFGAIILEAQTFLSTLSEADASFGTSAAGFNNKVEVATYHTITNEKSALDTDALSSVTSDDATVTTANAAVDYVAPTPGTTFTLTTGTDFTTGTANNDLINAPRGGSAGTTETYSATDQVDGGAGSDTLYVETDQATLNLATLANVEKIQVSGIGGTHTVTLSNDKAYTDLHNLNSTGSVVFNNIENATVKGSIQSAPNGQTTTYNYKATTLTGDSDNLTVLLSGADGDLDITGVSAANALETLTLNSVSDGELDDITLTNANTTKLVFTGAGATNVKGITGAAATLNTYDASGATGAVTVTGVNTTANTITGGSGNDTLAGAAGNDQITGGAGADQLTGGAGNDHLDGGAGNDVVVVSSIDQNDTVAGGEGTDVLSLAAAISYSSTDTDNGTNVSGFETLRATADLTQNMLALSGNTITTAEIGAASADLVAQSSAITTVNATSSGGSANIGLATDGTADSMAVTLGSATGSTASSLTLNAVDFETVNVSSVGADGNSLTIGNTSAGTLGVAGAAVTADLTKIVITGDKNVTVNANSSKTTAVSAIDASGFTGSTLIASASASTAAMTITANGNYSSNVTGGTGADTITVGDGGAALANTVNGGDGADTITAGSGNDTLNAGDDGGSVTAGAGDDTVSSGDGADTLTLGDGNDQVSSSGAGADTITGGAGNDTVTTAAAGADSIDGGAGNDNLSGGADNDTVIGGDGNDTLNGDAGNDSITGGAGNDTISDGAGDDTVDGGDGVDTITVSTGNDNISGGAGNDAITITGLSSADTIDGGAGTDSLTVTNSSSSTLTPSFVGIETLTVNTSSTFAIDFTSATDKTSTKTFTIAGTDSGGTDNVTVTNAPGGSSFTISDDNSWDGASATDTDNTGDIDEVTLDVVAGGSATVTIAANTDSNVATDTDLATNLEVGDASEVTLLSSGGGSANPLDHDLVALLLDDTETRTLTVTTGDYTGLDLGAITQAAALQTMTVTSNVGADTDVGTFVDATALSSLTLASTGLGSTLDTGALGGTTTAVLESLSLSAASGSTSTIGAITSSGATAMTSVSLAATGANSTLSHNTTNLGTSAVTSFTMSADDNASLITAGGNTITMGTVTTGNLTLGNNVTLGTNGSSTVAADFTTLNVTLGSTPTLTNDVIFDTGDTNTTNLNVTLNTGSAVINFNTGGADELRIGGINAVTIDESDFEKTTVTFNGTGAITWTGASQTTSLSVAGANAADSLTGGAGNDTLTGNGGDDTIAGGGGIDVLSGGDGADTITGGTGNDNLTGGDGADTLNASSGVDTITLTESSQANDDVKIANGGSADAAIQATTAGGDDTGADTIVGFDAGASADEITDVTLTGITDFNHGTDVVFGTGTTAGTSTGIIADFATSALIFDGNGDGDAIDDGIDLVINMTSLTIDGVAVTSTTRATALTNIKADIAYNITGTTGGDTIVAGPNADTISTGGGATSVTGGDAADSITGGGGVDTIVWTGTTAALIATEVGSTAGTDVDIAAGVGDSITTWASSTDKLNFPAALVTNAIGTEVDTLKSIAKGGTVANTDRYVFINNAASGDNGDETGGAIALLNALTTSAVAIGDSFIAFIDNDTNLYMYLVEQVSAADTIAAQDVTAIGVINGIVAVADGDIVSI